MKLLFYIIAITLPLVSYASDEVELSAILTEEYPPLNYSENGMVKGTATEMVAKILDRIDTNLSREDIQVAPWARAYKQTLNRKNTMLFSIARAKHREHLFKWVCPIAQIENGLLARKDENIKVASPKDLKKYRIGVVREDIGHQLLLKYLPSEDLDISNSSEANLKKLAEGRINIFSYDTGAAMFMLEKIGLNPDDFEVIYVLQKNPSCIAFNLETPDKTIAIFQTTLDNILAKENASAD